MRALVRHRRIQGGRADLGVGQHRLVRVAATAATDAATAAQAVLIFAAESGIDQDAEMEVAEVIDVADQVGATVGLDGHLADPDGGGHARLPEGSHGHGAGSRHEDVVHPDPHVRILVLAHRIGLDGVFRKSDLLQSAAGGAGKQVEADRRQHAHRGAEGVLARRHVVRPDEHVELREGTLHRHVIVRRGRFHLHPADAGGEHRRNDAGAFLVAELQVREAVLVAGEVAVPDTSGLRWRSCRKSSPRAGSPSRRSASTASGSRRSRRMRPHTTGTRRKRRRRPMTPARLSSARCPGRGRKSPGPACRPVRAPSTPAPWRRTPMQAPRRRQAGNILSFSSIPSKIIPQTIPTSRPAASRSAGKRPPQPYAHRP